jgi:hypothetical protein
MSYTSYVSTPLSDVIVNQSYNDAWYAFEYDDTNSSSDVTLYSNVKVVSQYALPVIFVFGTLGNALCVAVFARKLLTACSSRSGLGDNIELSAASGFSLLAISDLLLCVSGLPDSFLSNVGHADRGDVAEVARLYVRVIQPVLLNLWIFTSTWITCALSTERYLVITYPLKAKRRCSATLTAAVSLGIFTASLALNFPYFFKYAVHCDRTDCFLMPAKFLMDPVGSVAYHVVWSLFGCVVPLCILCFCNMRLLVALRRNRTLSFGTRMRERTTRVGSRERDRVKNDFRRKVSGGLEDKIKRGEGGNVDTDAGANSEFDGRGETELLGSLEGDIERRGENVVGGGGKEGEGPLTRRHARSLEKDGGRRARQVTLILVLIVTSYLLLVTPASCLELIRPLLPRHLLDWYRIAVVVTNTTQAAHFSCGFLLYACTSVRFRRDVGRLFSRCFHLPSGASSDLGLGLTRSACVLASTIDSHAPYRHSLLGQRLNKLHAGHGLAKSRL